MDTLPDIAAIVSALASIIALFLAHAQLRRTPAPRPVREPRIPASLTVIGVPTDCGRGPPATADNGPGGGDPPPPQIATDTAAAAC